MIKLQDVKLTLVPPKIQDLKVSLLWEFVKTDENLLLYFPDQCLSNFPPRQFFFAILSTIRPDLYHQILNQVEMKHWEKLANEQEIVQLDPRVMNELNQVRQKDWMMTKRSDRRVTLRGKIDRMGRE